ncbi:Pre-mRNA-splicing factor cwf19 [Basidiobolus ranarum]|uniref:Pre-mRNA-splicing factor cwf19 n=1 Tax=Basidiobolus ranarum TaxID=34480 RepID=A0ABR2X067_9FUNG
MSDGHKHKHGKEKHHKKDRDHDREHKSKKHHKDRSSKEHKRHKRSERDRRGKEEDVSESEMVWVEKEPLNVGNPIGVDSSILDSNTNVEATPDNTSAAARHSWMEEVTGFEEFVFTGGAGKSHRSEMDRKRKERDEERRKAIEQPAVSERELNVYLKEGRHVDDYSEEEQTAFEIGDSGSSWRMSKLKRIVERSQEENIPMEQLGYDQFGSIEEFERVLEEREVLDQRASKGRAAYIDDYFNRKLLEEKRSQFAENQYKETKQYDTSAQIAKTSVDSKPTLSQNELNKLKSQAMKARLMGMANADELEDQYEYEKARAANPEISRSNDPVPSKENVVVLPTFDSRGRMLDIGSSSRPSPGNKRKNPNSEANIDIASMLREEKYGNSRNMDMELAKRISRDTAYKDDLDYMDQNADKMATFKKMTDSQKRDFAVHDYKKSQSVLEKCDYCYQESNPPRVPVVSLGVKTYLALPNYEELLPGHCLIVPTQHCLSTLECEDDVWDEIRNFMKCLIQMHAKNNQGVIFMETVMNLSWHKHTVIECIPVAWELFEDAPAYFREAILSSEGEWTQHKKLIDTSKNGFRRSLTENLPFFHVWFTPDKGYGHVIEDDKDFPKWFGKEVIAGMCDVPPNLYRRPKRIPQQEAPHRVQSFLKQWKPWDWTKMLEEEN